ncbi:thiamine pyrophosphate-dependent enzyme [Frankia sp. Cj3]|uniref:thiamine pyrophosphate-dependent enzyme n=1 Tax=Frankia sp. Cj3 TaxID=2880976 RepID=UPI001EF71F5E|nr:thiamine pyrophosphate-dependent enzyme [Frankia sp. Cj3]
MSVPDTDGPNGAVTPVPRDPRDSRESPGSRESRDGSPEPVRLLTPGGERLPDQTYDPYLSDLTGADLYGLLRDMVIARRFDEEATALQRQGELGLWASLRGQEAAQVGSARALRADDMVFPSYREHAVAWCRGVDPLDILSLFRGVTHGGWDADEHGFQCYAIVVGSQTLHATGYAMGISRDHAVGAGSNGHRMPATLVYFGDGASSQGDVNEALNWAGVFEAPVVFFCQNNQWAISAPARRQTRVPIYQRASGFGIQGIQVDGNDVLATLAVTRWALESARQGRATLVEAVTYRMGAHTTADDPSRYRHAEELAYWGEHDPLQRMTAYLRAGGLLDDHAAAALDAEADALAATLRERCLSLPDPSPRSMFEHVYVDEPRTLAAMRDAWPAAVPAEPADPEPAGPAAWNTRPPLTRVTQIAATAGVTAGMPAAPGPARQPRKAV